jgi:hypothetical protein
LTTHLKPAQRPSIPSLLLAVALFVLVPSGATAQDPEIPPFYQTSVGLFYPAHADFEGTYGVTSEFIWGTGFGVPLSADYFYLVIDLSWFQANAYQPGTPAAEVELSQAFWHLGLMNKVFITKSVAVRFQGGLNYNSIETKVMPEGGAETKRELKRKIGFFGGAGLENQVFGGRVGIFFDFVYDYRRSTDPLMYGDFGGSRVVGGLAAYLF